MGTGSGGGLGGRGGVPEGRLCCSGRGVLACGGGGAHWPVVAVCAEGCWHVSKCMAQDGHLVWPGGPRARVVLLCGPGAASEGLWGGGQGGHVGRAAEGASAVSGEGASRAAVGDPLAGGRCATEG